VEGVPYVGFAGATLKDAPHPNAARLFLNFLLDDEPQLMQAREGFRPAVAGMDEKVPPELRPYTTGAKLLGTTRPEARNKMMKLAQGIYK
jgi:iron(III) transport system substrate-binding protein